MPKRLKMVISGGGSGIGAEIAKTLSKEGHPVAICGRRENKLIGVAKTDKNIIYRVCDVSKEENVKSFMNFVKSKFGYVDVVINCAGTFGSISRFDTDTTSSREWKKTFEINTFGTYLITKYFLPLLLKSDVKKIINFAGGGAFSPLPNYSAYAVSKAAVVRFSENIAVELSDMGVQVNCIAPGFVATELHDATLKAGRKKAGKSYDFTIKKLKEGSGVPIKNVVKCVKFLISDESKGLTGKTISVSFDRWDTHTFREAINEISSSDLYTLRRLNLINLNENPSLRKKLLAIQNTR